MGRWPSETMSHLLLVVRLRCMLQWQTETDSLGLTLTDASPPSRELEGILSTILSSEIFLTFFNGGLNPQTPPSGYATVYNEWSEACGTDARSVVTLWRQRYMCLKLSITNRGRSLTVLPMWCRGWVNFRPSAVSTVTASNTRTHTLTTQLQSHVCC